MSIESAIASIFGAGWTFIRGFNPAPGGHKGVDIATKLGTPVHALHNGRVVYASWAGGGGLGYVHPYSAPFNLAETSKYLANGGGNVVVIEDANGTFYQYAHLSNIGVQVGQNIVEGQQIGNVGDTGNATGPHLHFAMFDSNKNWIDPTSFLENLNTGGTTANGTVADWVTFFSGKGGPAPGDTWDNYINYQLVNEPNLTTVMNQALTNLGWHGNKVVSVSDYPTLAAQILAITGNASPTQVSTGGYVGNPNSILGSGIGGSGISLFPNIPWVQVGAVVFGGILIVLGAKKMVDSAA